MTVRRTAFLLSVLAMITPAGIGHAGDRPFTLVTMGTSLTARGGWQSALETALTQCMERPVVMPIVARSGETSRWGLRHAADALAPDPDAVLVEFAVNDAALNRLMSLNESTQNMRALLERLLAHVPKPRVVVMGMSPILGPRGLIRPWLDDYVAAHRDVAHTLGAEFVDHAPAWRALERRVLVRALPDGAHPDPAMAARIMVPTLTKLLGGSQCSGTGARSTNDGKPPR